MRKFKKRFLVIFVSVWFLVIFVLGLIIAWNVGCKEVKWTEPPPYFKHQINEFLGKILDRIVQGVPYNSDHYFHIKSVFDTPNNTFDFPFRYWAAIDGQGEEIFVNKRLILLAENEAEIAAAIAHEVSHVVVLDLLPKSLWPRGDETSKRFDYLPSFIMIQYPPYREFLPRFWLEEEHALIDCVGIELMSKANYSTYSAVDILEKIIYGETRKDLIRQNAEKYFRENQKKWILFTPEDLEKIKSFCKIHEQLNGE